MSLTLSATIRTAARKKVKGLRRTGQTPLILYGHGVEPTMLATASKTLHTAWKEAGSSQLVDLNIDGGSNVKTLIHDVQLHPVSGVILHADLYQVKMTEKLETEIPLKFVGEAPAVKDLEGNLITEKDALEVRCLPADLVPEFNVDISALKTFDDVIKVADVPVPATIEVLNDPDEMVALVTPPRSEEELAEELAPTGAEAEAAGIAEIEAQAEAEKAEEAAEATEEKEQKEQAE